MSLRQHRRRRPCSGRAGREHQRWLALLDDEPAGLGRLGHDRANKPDGAAYVYVAPEHRGNGIGRRLADTVLGALGEEVRHVDLELTTPPPADGDPVLLGPGGHGALRADAAGAKLALARGVELGQIMVVNRYDVADPTVPPADVLAEAQRAGADYEVRIVEDVAPPELAEGIAVCKERMFTDVPAGALHAHHPRWDAARLAEEYAQLTLTLRLFVAVAVRPASEQVVALSEFLLPRSRPTSSLAQRDTILLQDHRCHRPGILVNAADNTPMLAVSEALGFHPVSTHARCQLTRTVDFPT